MWMSLAFAALFGLLGIILLAVAYKVFDWVEHKIDFAAEIKNGNIAAAIVVAGLLIAVGLVVGAAVGG